jgi:hypothetical protein
MSLVRVALILFLVGGDDFKDAAAKLSRASAQAIT